MELFRKVNRQKANPKFRKKPLVEEEAHQPFLAEGASTSNHLEFATLETPLRDNDTQVTKKTSVTISVEKEKPRPKKAQKLAGIGLSFGDDDESQEPIFQIKRSSASRKLAKHKLNELEIEPRAEQSKTVRESYASYDEDTLCLLRKQQDSLNSQVERAIRQQPIDDEPWFDGAGTTQTVIPDANHIYLAKKKRKRYGRDYVSLTTKSAGRDEYGSRLVREDDEIGDGEEELNMHMGERMSLKRGDMKAQLKKQAQEEMQRALDEFERLGDSDEEFAALERDRLRHAFGDSKVPATIDKALPMPKVSPLPTFSSIKESILFEIHSHNERLLPYQASIQSKSTILASLDVQLRDMSLQREALESRIHKYVNLLNRFPQK
ncbi:hypothetical protein L0F63_006817 [Massospora cicadina]|nr:hypothetical protein L0F63_006817 [Massospora cicadina]